MTSAPRLRRRRARRRGAVANRSATRLRRLVRRSMVLQIAPAAGRRGDRAASPARGPRPSRRSRATRRTRRRASREGLADHAASASTTIADDGRAAGARTADRADAGAVPGRRCGLRAAEGGRERAPAANWCATPPRAGSTQALAPLDVPRFDPLPALRAALPGPDLFFQQTVHLTPRGHEIVADALERSSRAAAGRAAGAALNRRWSSTRSTSSGSSSSSTRSTGCCRTAAQNWLLLVASYYFYAAGTGASSACWSPRRSSTTAARWRSAGRDDPRPAAAGCCALSLGFNLTLLGFFKYFNFFADNLHALFGALGWQLDFVTLRVLLPVGISFYTFVTMSYVIDVYRREIPADARTSSTSRCSSPSSRTSSPARSCARRGCCRRSQLPRTHHARADARRRCGSSPGASSRRSSSPTTWPPSRTRVFDPARTRTGVDVLLGTYAFAFQIYGDFAGYSNIARGTSKLMGIELIENFRFPYFVRTPQDFWRHWHISLSTWLRDYLYIPLGGSRGSAWQHAAQPADHDGARRAVARRGVDVRALGPVSRRAAHRVPRGRRVASLNALAHSGPARVARVTRGS